jgi:hypothetical protein
MTSTVYVLDANVLSRLSADQRRSSFVRHHCRIPAEVLHEVEGFPDIAQLRALNIPVTGEMLECLSEVMKTVAPRDFKLVDLYSNKGNGDPILVAAALTGMRQASETLFDEDWKVVSDDHAVRAKAEEHVVDSLGTTDFVLLLPAC